MRVGYDVCGNICVMKFGREIKLKEKKKFALEYLKTHKSVTTVLEKLDGFKGRLRTHKTKWVAGEKIKEALYKENGCVFRFNVDTCYFSPRLSSERKDLALKVKKKERVLVMFGGVGPFAIVISKMSGCKKVVSVELGRDCTKYAKVNVKRNKLDNVEIVGGDVRKKVPELKEKVSGRVRDFKFDRIVMARPNLKDSFLDVAFKKIAKNGIVHYYGFYPEEEKSKMLEMIKSEAKKARKKIKILKVKKAGEIGVRKVRYRVDIKVY